MTGVEVGVFIYPAEKPWPHALDHRLETAIVRQIDGQGTSGWD
jgi:hypothetical protein